MDIVLSFLGLMDSTIFAMMEIPVLAFFLVGSLAVSVLGVILLLKDAARGRNAR